MNFLGLHGNFDLVKKLNLEKVLSLILLYQPISRAKISKLANLNKVTVSSCVEFLLDKGIIREIGTTESTRGRPPTLIDMNGAAGVYIGIDVEVHICRFMITDLSGKCLEQYTIPIPDEAPAQLLDLISKQVMSLGEKYKNTPLGVLGAGLALPGHYNQNTGVLEYVANMQQWNGFPVRSKLEELNLGFPLYIETIANAGALGEIHFGKSNVSRHLIYINGTWGLGVGVSANGNIYSGFSGFAGRLGHSPIHFNGKKCTCGNKGCWEAYASIRSMYEKLYPGENLTTKPFEDVLRKISENDPQTVAGIHELSHYLAIGMVNVINAYNPSDICIGGYLGLLGQPLLNQVKSTIDRMLPAHYMKDLNIYCSELGDWCVAYGAVSLVRSQLLNILMEAEG